MRINLKPNTTSMDNVTSKSLVELLLQKTSEKKIEWGRGSSRNSFKVELNSATFVVTFLPKDEDGPDYIKLQMLNGTGATISIMELYDYEAEYELLSRLFYAAKDSCTKETETIEKVFEELQSI